MVVAATGFFDGLHLGHLSVLNRVKELAKEQEKSSAVITFWPHPRAFFQQDAAHFRLLSSVEEKGERLKEIGIDQFHIIPFDREFASLTTQQFFEKYLVEQYGVSTLVAGYDHRVGRDTSQSQEEMFAIARSCGIEPVRVEEFHNPFKVVISSTKIRDALRGGEIELANSMLGYNYPLEGVVVSGRRIGRTIGFPTANLKLLEPLKLLPANGVYAGYCYFEERCYKAIINIGTRPTVSLSSDRSIEVHLLNFDQQIYGLPLKVKFIKRLRDEIKFASLEQLKSQLERDRGRAEELLPQL